jgi:general secretion pathway protein A
MYQEFFGLTTAPFELTPDPAFLYLPPQHQEALTTLRYALRARKGLTVLTGEAGLGKTTLLQVAFGDQAELPTRLLIIKNPALNRAEFLETLTHEFSLGSAAAASKTVLLRNLERKLLEYRDRGIYVALIVDEAHTMPWDLLEEIRLLGNIETTSGKLLSTILVGQPELSDRLDEPSLRQLKQRVALRCELTPLSHREVFEYISTRSKVAGNLGADLFTRDALALIYQQSQGIPRMINVICDNALVSGFACAQRPVGVELVREVCRDFHLSPGPASFVETVQPAAPADVSAAPERGFLSVPGSVEDDAAAVEQERPRFSMFHRAGLGRIARVFQR